mmetsp:Transcript_575/g.1517  ORF Transcript_575/g.1517 Transcript_575/m.1517 type:complete len:148 (-) Transcript_575:1556-1999(-)
MRRLVHFLKERMKVDEVVQESPTAFLHKLDNQEEDFSKPMKFVADRLRSLLRTLEVTDVQDFSPIMLIADFATLVSTFQKGFGIIIEPFDERTPMLRDPLFQLCCNDASIAIKPVRQFYLEGLTHRQLRRTRKHRHTIDCCNCPCLG